MAVAFDTHFSDEVCRVHAWRALLVLEWLRTPTASSIASASRAVIALGRAHPGPMLLCALTPAEVTLPDGESRDAIRAAIQRIDPYLAGAVSVVRARGFPAAAMRALLTGIAQALRPRYSVSFVATEAEAAVFFARHWPAADAPAPLATELAAALAKLDGR